MSIQDAELIFSDGQLLTTTADSESNVDLGAGTDYLGDATVLDVGEGGKHAWLNIVVTTALAGGTSLAWALFDDTDDSGFAATNPIIAGPAIATASLIAGYVVARVQIPPDLRRYLQVVYTIVGTHTAGAVDAWIGPAGQGPAKSASLEV